MNLRIFINSPMLHNGDAAEAYLLAVKPLRWSGYVGPDGTVRLMVEVTNQNDLTRADGCG